MADKAGEEDLANVEFETSEDVEVIPTFDRMGLREDLLRGIYAYGFEKPSAIQQRAIRPLLKGRDVIARHSPVLARQQPSLFRSCSPSTLQSEKHRYSNYLWHQLFEFASLVEKLKAI